MRVVAYTCPACGAHLSVLDEMKQVTCEYCDTTFQVIADEDPSERQAPKSIRAEQGTKLTPERAKAAGDLQPQQKNAVHVFLVALAVLMFLPAVLMVVPLYLPYKMIRPQGMGLGKFCLWTFGWLCFFPIPLAILLMRRQRERSR